MKIRTIVLTALLFTMSLTGFPGEAISQTQDLSQLISAVSFDITFNGNYTYVHVMIGGTMYVFVYDGLTLIHYYPEG